MIAVDTNVIVRLLTGDDAKQAKRAHALFAQKTIYLPKTVMLETEWVLRRLYGFSAHEVADALSSLIALPNAHCEDVGAVVEALGWAQKGFDFADALHLASSKVANKFATFDAKLTKLAVRFTDLVAVSP